MKSTRWALALPACLLATVAYATDTSDEQANDTLEQVTIQGTQYNTDVTVAGKVPLNPREIPNSVTVITEQRMEDQNMITVADALAQVPGVTVIPNDGTQSQYRSRGYTLDVMYDGVPGPQALSGYQQLDLSIYERVEVLRGPAGVLEGAGDPGGTVNLVTKQGLDHFALWTSVSAGSWDDHRGTFDITGPLTENKELRGRFLASYEQSDAFTDRTRFVKGVTYGTLDWDVAEGTTASVSVVTQDDRTHAPYFGLPTYESGPLLNVNRGTNPYQSWNEILWRIRDYSLAASHRFDDGWVVKLTARKRTQELFLHDAIAWDGVDDSNYTLPYVQEEYHYHDDLRSVDLFAEGPLQLFGRTHTLLFGANYASQSSPYEGVELYNNPITISFHHPELLPDFTAPYNDAGLSTQHQVGVYSQARFSLADPLTLVGGARVTDYNSGSQELPPGPQPWSWYPGDSAHNKITPYGGLVYDITKQVTLYGSYADIFTPQSTLLEANGHPLPPVLGRQYEVGSKGDFLERRLSASVAVFKLQDVNRALVDPINEGFYIPAGEVESRGWEAQISGSPAPEYEIQAGYTRLDTKYLTAPTDREGLTFDSLEPRHSWKFWAVRRFQENARQQRHRRPGIQHTERHLGTTPLSRRLHGGLGLGRIPDQPTVFGEPEHQQRVRQGLLRPPRRQQ